MARPNRLLTQNHSGNVSGSKAATSDCIGNLATMLSRHPLIIMRDGHERANTREVLEGGIIGGE